MNRPCVAPSLVCALSATCFAYLFAEGPEYCLRPDKEDGTQANRVVCCTGPARWQGWKDDPHYWEDIQGLGKHDKQMLIGELRMSVSFEQANCKSPLECPHLTLDTRGRDSRGCPGIDAGLRDFLRWQVGQHRDARRDPEPEVTQLGSFDAGSSGRLTIWQIRCSFWHDYLLTMIARRDVLVSIYLEAPDIKDIVPKLDSLKELARSVRFYDASAVLPDIIKIDARRLSDEVIKQQLLRLTPPGTSMDKVHEIVGWHLVLRQSPELHLSGELHWVKGDLYAQIDNYPSPGRFATLVEAFWKSDRQHKLRDIEVRRRVIAYKAKKALPVR